MATTLEIWARAERTALQEDIRYLKGGSKTISPSGDDITKMMLERLEARLEGVNIELKRIEDARES